MDLTVDSVIIPINFYGRYSNPMDPAWSIKGDVHWTAASDAIKAAVIDIDGWTTVSWCQSTFLEVMTLLIIDRCFQLVMDDQ